MNRYGWQNCSKWILLFAAAGSLVACAAFKPKVDSLGAGGATPPRKVEMARVSYLGVPCYLHNVRWPEESLAAIARWYTGSGENARILARITPNLRAQDLRKGDVVFIPQEMARRTDPMPRSYARRYGSPPVAEKQAAPAAPPPAREDDPEDDSPPAPYGPRTFPD
jgi:hypothetical protein